MPVPCYIPCEMCGDKEMCEIPFDFRKVPLFNQAKLFEVLSKVAESRGPFDFKTEVIKALKGDKKK